MSSLCCCLACGSVEGTITVRWNDWVAACANRSDGEMRLAAAEVAGVAAEKPSLWQCGACASVSMTKIPTNDQLAAFYREYHATDDWIRKADKKILRAMKRILPLRLMIRGRHFLDVGASIGTAAEAARRLGYAATAQEIGEKAVAHGRSMFPKVTFVEGFLSEVPKQRLFDLIYGAEVIEHVPDPAVFARQLAARLRPGGRIFLTTPDAGHAKRPEPFITWGSVKPPEHITLFTQTGLRALMESTGFCDIRFLPYAKPGIRMIAKRAP